MECPNDRGSMTLQRRLKTVTLGCNIWRFFADYYVCPVCGLEIEPDALKKVSGITHAAESSGNCKTHSRMTRFIRKLRTGSTRS
jgi:hypothetical protein